jgi:EAL domain-containing protein (putative c-di-GMP-specific phosphodiesterase class I)
MHASPSKGSRDYSYPAGYAGLRHILRLRPDIIKLDIDLTRGIDADPARHALAGALMTFAHEIGAVVVAEGTDRVARTAPAWPAAGSGLR